MSYRDIEELMAERGVDIDHSTINRWVTKYAPKLEVVFTKRYKKPIGSRWIMDKTHTKLKGRWCYLYRSVDKQGQAIDCYLVKNLDKTATKQFFIKAIGYSGQPEKITIDKSESNLSALKTMNKSLSKNHQIEARQIKYLNNIIEQDHRFIKQVTKPMLGFKDFYSARATLAGIKLHHILRKYQHNETENISVLKQFHALAA